MDKILKLIDENKNQSAVIATMLDWASAFDRQDPTLAIRKFLKMGVRTELIPVLSSYLTNRKMQVRLEDKLSSTYHLPGGGAQGTLLGVLQFLVQNNDNADCLEEDMRYKFVDDLSILELLLFGGFCLIVISWTTLQVILALMKVSFLAQTSKHRKIWTL